MIDIGKNDRSIRATNHLLVYIDVLGCRDFILSEKNDEVLLKMYQHYNTLYYETEYRRLYEPKRKVKIFSDNIIIAEEIDFTNFNGLMKLKILESFFRMIRTFQFVLLNSGWYVRGAADIGKLYIDETFVWGKSLLKSYTLESQKAIYPRIIISKELAAEISFSLDDLITKKVLSEDSDGLLFVDYFNFEGDDGGRFPILLGHIRERLIDSFEKSKGNVSVHKKQRWVIEKFNEECFRSGRESFLIN